MSPVAQYFAFLWTFRFWISVIAVFVLRSLINTWILKFRMPPGPIPWPFLGNFPIIMKSKGQMHDFFLEMSKKYGDPMTFFFAHTPCLILTKYETIKDVFQQLTFSDRFDSPVLDIMFDGKRDMSFGPHDQLFLLLRKVASKSMRTLIDAEKLEDQVAWATEFSIDQMKAEATVEPRHHVRNLIYNIILAFAFGKTFKVDDPEFIRLLQASETGNKNFTKLFALDFLPLAKYWPLRRLPLVQESKASTGVFREFATSQVQEHRKTYEPGNIRDLADALITEQIQLITEGGGQTLSDDDINGIILDFYTAGTETTSTTLTWFILYMTLNPEIQEECFQEIRETIGDRQPHLRDRVKMPIIEASIMETLRLRPPASMGLPRSPNSDTQIGKHFIPKGTFTMANLYAMHVDPDYWQDPLKFEPRGHFIDESGQVRKPPSFMPFGTGRRVCMGEQLAKNVLFLAAVNLLKNIKWTRVDGHKYTMDPDPEVQFAFTAQVYPVRMEIRK